MATKKKKTRKAGKSLPAPGKPTRAVQGERPVVVGEKRLAVEGLGIKSILVPIDFSAHSKNALKYAVPMAEEFDAALHLVYVVEPTIYPADLGFGQVVLPGVEEELRQKGAEELKSLIEKEIGSRVKASSSVRTGNPHQEILAEADEKDVNLIIVATHGHSGVEHMLFGSTADRIVHHAKCPVLTVRPQAK
jgi:nucleotide-binding universal stress UspA family protein